jgi:hypothetical protein
MIGRPFQPGNTFGQGRPRGSPNRKGLLAQQLLLNQSEEIIQTLIDRAKKGDRAALALCVERLIPRLKDVPELPVEEDTEATKLDLSVLTDEELELFGRMLTKASNAEPRPQNAAPRQLADALPRDEPHPDADAEPASQAA